MTFRTLAATGALAVALGVPALAETPPNAMVMAFNIDAITTFDPAQIAEAVTDEFITNTCDSLANFAPDDESTSIPALAESWDVSEDGLTITFHLRDGIVFPDGTPGTAGDLVWSMERVVRLGFGNAAQLTEFGFTTDNIAQRITAPDDRTVVMTLDKPYPISLILSSIAANRVAAMLHRTVLEANEKDGDLGNAYLQSATACVGPYSLRQWNPGEVVVLEANEHYHGEKPKLQRILIRHVAEPGTQRLLLEKGDIDVARNLGAEDLLALEAVDGIEIVSTLIPSQFYLGMNAAKEPFDDPKVRLAMRWLVDYQGLADSVMKGVGVPRAAPVPLGSFGALDEAEGQPFHADLDKARELLAEAGYPDGFTATMIIGSHPYADPIAQSIQQNAAQIGVTLNIERMANAQLFARHRSRDFQAAMLGFRASVPDAHGMLSRFVYNPDNSLEAQLTQYPSWRSDYYDEAMNARVDEALFERDPEKRAELYHQLQRDIMQEGPMAYVMQSINVAAKRDTLKDWTWNGFRIYYGKASK